MMAAIGYMKGNIQKLEKITASILCPFCYFSNSVDKNTLTCKNCSTTIPRNYGANQKKDKHGNSIVD